MADIIPIDRCPILWPQGYLCKKECCLKCEDARVNCSMFCGPKAFEEKKCTYRKTNQRRTI